MPAPQAYTIQEALNRDAALQQAYKWVAADPKNRAWANMAPTGSMKSKFDENSISLLQRSDGSDIKKGDLVVYADDKKFGPNSNVIHEVAEMNKTHFIGNGVTNKHYDGWSPRAGIKWKANVIKYPGTSK